MLAEQFGMEYVDVDGTKRRPYIIHRTSMGCYERSLALIIEKFAGALPLWMSAEQVRILPIAERHQEAAKAVEAKLKAAKIRAKCDNRNEKIGYKIREAQTEKVPYMLVIGDKEAEDGTVSVRLRSVGDKGSMPVDDFVKKVTYESAAMLNNLE